MSLVKRKMFLSLIKSKGDVPAYNVIGSELEEFTIAMNANVVKKQNILGENSILIDKYDKQASVAPYIAEAGTDIFKWLQACIDEERTLDDLNTTMVYVKLWEPAVSGGYPAIEEEVVVEIVSFGGNTEGYQIPYNVHFTGIKKVGVFNPTTKVFTENTYTISFEENGGSTVADITSPAGAVVTQPEDPTKALNDFAGWFSDEELSVPYVFSTMPAADITLYAKWTLSE